MDPAMKTQFRTVKFMEVLMSAWNADLLILLLMENVWKPMMDALVQEMILCATSADTTHYFKVINAKEW